MRSLGEIAHGITSNLLTRAADVVSNERRKLLLVAGENALDAIRHLNRGTTSLIIRSRRIPDFFDLI